MDPVTKMIKVLFSVHSIIKSIRRRKLEEILVEFLTRSRLAYIIIDFTPIYIGHTYE